MADIKVSAMSPLPAVNATYTYGITGSSTEGKVAVNTTDGLVAYTGSDIFPFGDQTANLGTGSKRFIGLYGALTFAVNFSSGSNSNIVKWTDGVGPAFKDRGTVKTLTLDIQSLSSDRTATWPDAAGTVTINNDSQAPFTPTTGQTIAPTATGAAVMCFINPSGTLAALTLTLPTGLFPGQLLYAVFTQIITTLTVTSTNIGTDGRASPSAATAVSTFAWSWNAAQAKWNRFL